MAFPIFEFQSHQDLAQELYFAKQANNFCLAQADLSSNVLCPSFLSLILVKIKGFFDRGMSGDFGINF
jgi:hypothetical protein